MNNLENWPVSDYILTSMVIDQLERLGWEELGGPVHMVASHVISSPNLSCAIRLDPDRITLMLRDPHIRPISANTPVFKQLLKSDQKADDPVFWATSTILDFLVK